MILKIDVIKKIEILKIVIIKSMISRDWMINTSRKPGFLKVPRSGCQKNDIYNASYYNIGERDYLNNKVLPNMSSGISDT